MFTRDDPNWSDAAWGVTVVPWVMIGALSLLTLGSYVYGRLTKGHWDWGVQSLRKVDVLTGIAPHLAPRHVGRGKWYQKFILNVLNKI